MDYVQIILNEFEIRRSRDRFYSLRKFAKDLGLNPMHLSNIMKYKRGLSKKSAMKVAASFGFKPNQMTKFRFLVSAQSGRSKFEKNLAKQGLKRQILKNIDFHRKLKSF